MAEMKSAFEKALERAQRLGKLSPEEIRQMRERELIPVGRALADRYLGHGYGQVLAEEANRYSDEEREIVLRVASSRLVEAIELGNLESTEKAVEGILVLKGEEEIGEIKGQIKSIFDQYQQVEKAGYKEQKGEIERKQRELLHQLRISGTAIAEINLEARDAWKEILAALYSHFDQRLQQLKQQLLNIITWGQ